MRSRATLALVALVLAPALAGCSAPGTTLPGGGIGAPKLEPGDFWTFENAQNEFEAFAFAHVLDETTFNGSQAWDIRSEIIQECSATTFVVRAADLSIVRDADESCKGRVARHDYAILDLLRFPLANETFTTTFHGDVAATNGPRVVTLQYAGRVTVQAGAFDAWRTHVDWGDGTSLTAFYAPSVKWFVKISNARDGAAELTDFGNSQHAFHGG
ncbi:MAG: hypothetical protein ACYDCK_04680 [Thermoplasmatota archaeon]